MIQLLIITILLGSLCFYSTSTKIVLKNRCTIEKWMLENPKKVKFLGMFFYLASLYIAVHQFDFIGGIIWWFFLICIIMCLLIVFMPLRNS